MVHEFERLLRDITSDYAYKNGNSASTIDRAHTLSVQLHQVAEPAQQFIIDTVDEMNTTLMYLGMYSLTPEFQAGMQFFSAYMAPYCAPVTNTSTGSGSINIRAENLKYSNSSKYPNRPYQDSPSIIQSIIDSGAPSADPRGTNGLWWNVEGTYNGSSGYYELLISPDKTTIWHFLFKGSN